MAMSAQGEPHAASLYVEIGRVWEEQLNKPRNAAMAYQRAFHLNARDPSVLHASRRLFTEVGNWGMVVQILQAEIDGTDRPVTWLRNVEAQGPSMSRNQGIQAAAGDVVTFLDDDDLLDPSALEAIAKHFANYPQTECLFVNVGAFGPGSEGLPCRSRLPVP